MIRRVCNVAEALRPGPPAPPHHSHEALQQDLQANDRSRHDHPAIVGADLNRSSPHSVQFVLVHEATIRLMWMKHEDNPDAR